MKIVITSSGNNANAKVDNHFGRCAFFVFYDTLTRGVEFLPNPCKEFEEGAGEAAVKLIAARGITKIVTGELGVKVKPILDSLKIQVIILRHKEKSIEEILNMLNHYA